MALIRSFLMPGGRRVRIVQAIAVGLVLLSAIDTTDEDAGLFSEFLFLAFVTAWTMVVTGYGSFAVFALLRAKNTAEYVADGRLGRDLIRQARS